METVLINLKKYFLISLKELSDFILKTDTGLLKPVQDYDELVECMGHLLAVKERHSSTDAMFEPLKQTIELLKTYNQEMPEEVHNQLQVYSNFDHVTCPV